MLKGVRRPDETAGLDLSQRLMVRVGALLKKNTAVSRVLLETAKPGSPAESLLLDSRVLHAAPQLDAAKLQQIAADFPALAPLEVATADDGFQVLCLQEETQADEGWGAAAAGSNALAVPGAQGVSRVAPDVEASVDVHQLRLKLATATAANDRIEALRVLILSMRANNDKAELLLQGLADRDASVRAESAGMLRLIGVDVDIAEALAQLSHTDNSRRTAAAERLQKLLGNTQRAGSAAEFENAAAVVSLLTILRQEEDFDLLAHAFELLSACAGVFAANRGRLAELTRLTLNVITVAAARGAASRELEQILPPAHRLFDRLAERAGGDLSSALFAERTRAASPATEAFVIESLLDTLPAQHASETELVRFAAEWLARDIEEGRDSRAIGARLIKRGAPAIAPLCEAFANATAGAQLYVLLMLDEIARQHTLPPQDLETAAKILLQIMENGGKGHRTAAMQCRFAADPKLSKDTRAQLARAFLQSAGDFMFDSDIEKVESVLARMGLPAIEPLLKSLQPERQVHERIRAARLLGELVANLKPARGELPRVQDAVTDILRKLQALALDEKFPDRGELLVALGKIIASPAASHAADDVISRTLLEAADSHDEKIVFRAFEGLAHLAASRRATPELVAGTAERMLKALANVNAEVNIEQKPAGQTGEITLEITGGESYVHVLPVILHALQRLSGAPNCPGATQRQIARELLEYWRKIRMGEILWGPANHMLVVDALRAVGCQPNLSDDLRIDILKGLAQKLAQIPIARAISEILAANDTPGTAAAALTIGFGLLNRRGPDGKFDSEDRPEILRALARIINRKLLGAPNDARAATFRKQVVDELFSGLKDLVGGAYESLNKLRTSANLPADLRGEVERRLSDYHRLAAI